MYLQKKQICILTGKFELSEVTYPESLILPKISKPIIHGTKLSRLITELPA